MTLLGARKGGARVGDAAASEGDAVRWTGLARRITQGDRTAEAELSQEFHARVRLLASVRLHGSDTAQDIAQDTILATIEALRGGTVREPDKLPAFVLGIARNLVNNHHRTTARRREVSQDPPDHAAETEAGWVGADNERRALVRAALKRVGRIDRRILLLTLVEGMTPREIAPIVGLKAEVVRTRKARAVKTIADEIRTLTRMSRIDHI